MSQWLKHVRLKKYEVALLAILIGIIILQGYFFVRTSIHVTNISSDALLAQAQSGALELEISLLDNLNNMISYASIPYIKEPDISSTDKTLFLQKFDSNNSKLYYADVHGKVFMPNGAAFDISSRQYYKDCLSGLNVLSDYLSAWGYSNKFMALATPIYEEGIGGNIVGVIIRTYEASDVQKIIERILLKQSNSVDIVNAAGELLFHTDIHGFISEVSDDGIAGIEGFLQSAKGKNEILSSAGADVLVAYAPITPKGITYVNSFLAFTITVPRTDVVGVIVPMIPPTVFIVAVLMLLYAKSRSRNEQLEASLINKERFTNSVMSMLRLITIEVKNNGEIVGFNTYAQDALKLFVVEGKALNIYDSVKTDCVNTLTGMLHDLEDGNPIQNLLLPFYSADDLVYLMLHSDGERIKNSNGYLYEIIGVDVTDRVLREEELWNTSELYRLSLEASNDIFFEINLKSLKIRFTEKDLPVLNYKSTTFDFLDYINEYVHADERERLLRFFLDDAYEEQELMTLDNRIKFGEDEYRWVNTQLKTLYDKKGKPIKCIGSYTDINERKLYELKVERLAYFDSLTELPNHRYFFHTVEGLISCGQSGALLYIDVNNFKTVNSDLGSAKADEILKLLATAIKEIFGEIGMTSRYGDDEFAVFINHVTDKKAVEDNIYLMFAAINQKSAYSDISYHVEISVGVAFAQTDEVKCEQLFSHANIALHEAKRKGRNSYAFFDKEAQKTIDMGINLSGALSRNELYLEYLPIVDSKTRELTGVEALCRWRSKEFGLVPPNIFINLAEENSLIVQIGNWVIESAFAFLQSLEQKGVKNIYVSVNISKYQLISYDFSGFVADMIRKYDITPSLVKFEITESVIVTHIDDVIEKMEQLRAYGIEFSLDDFGTRYSSINFLQKLPISELKLDRSISYDLLINRDSMEIAKTLLSFAKALNISTVIEGIENQRQYDYISTLLEVDRYQGFHISKPLTEADLVQSWIKLPVI